ncbi:MAG: AtpZ/AtpI family protein [Hydrogenibacillus sp.]|nr:AtpZ/AtpI family protein [Hydrogenibacillus sp.]
MALAGETSAKLVGPTLIGLWLGHALDRRFQAAPLFLIVFLLLGMAAGIILLMRTLMNRSGDR